MNRTWIKNTMFISLLSIFFSVGTLAFAKGPIDINQAKQIALEHAKLNAKDVSYHKAAKDNDDHKQQFEIEFYHNNTEYDYEIDAITGEITEFEIEYPRSTKQSGRMISEDEAKKIALEHSTFTGHAMHAMKVKLDKDYNSAEYDIEFFHNNAKYEYEIDAYTGKINSVSKN